MRKVELRSSLLEETGHRCIYCGKEIDFKTMTMDHIFPETYGGSQDSDNLVAACRGCNARKGSMTVRDAFHSRQLTGRDEFLSRVRGLESEGLLPSGKAELLSSEETIETPAQKPVTLPPGQLARLRKESVGSCIYCGRQVSLRTLCEDLIVPEDEGGRRKPDNMVVSCLWCSEKKGDMGAMRYAEDSMGPKEYGAYRRRVCTLVWQGHMPEAKGALLVKDAPVLPEKVWRIKLGRLTVRISWKRKKG